MFLRKIKDIDLLKAHVEHCERCTKGHADRCCRLLSGMTGKTIRDARQRRNQEALANSIGAPATQEHQHSPQRQGTMPPAAGQKGNKGDGKNGDKGKGKGGGTAPLDSKGEGKGIADGDAAPERTCALYLLGKRKQQHVQQDKSCEYGKHTPNRSRAEGAADLQDVGG